MPFARKILYGLNKIKDIINNLISSHNTNKDAHSGGFNNLKLWSKYTNSTAPFTGNDEQINITANNYKIVDDDNKSIADFHANFNKSTSNGVTRLGTTAVMQANARNGDTGESAYIAVYVSVDGTKKSIYASPYTYLSYMYATDPVSPDHVANKKYVDEVTADLASNKYVEEAQKAASCPTGMISYFYLTLAQAESLYSITTTDGVTKGAGWVVCDGRLYYNKNGTQTTSPYLIGYFLQGTKKDSELNQPIPAGLPAFDGVFTCDEAGAHQHIDFGITDCSAGSLVVPTINRYNHTVLAGAHTHNVSVTYPSTSIYGTADTVQPATVRMIPMMKI